MNITRVTDAILNGTDVRKAIAEGTELDLTEPGFTSTDMKYRMALLTALQDCGVIEGTDSEDLMYNFFLANNFAAVKKALDLTDIELPLLGEGEESYDELQARRAALSSNFPKVIDVMNKAIKQLGTAPLDPSTVKVGNGMSGSLGATRWQTTDFDAKDTEGHTVRASYSGVSVYGRTHKETKHLSMVNMSEPFLHFFEPAISQAMESDMEGEVANILMRFLDDMLSYSQVKMELKKTIEKYSKEYPGSYIRRELMKTQHPEFPK